MKTVRFDRNDNLVDAIYGLDTSELDFSLCAPDEIFIAPSKRIARFADETYVDFSLEGEAFDKQTKQELIEKYRKIVEQGGMLFE